MKWFIVVAIPLLIVVGCNSKEMKEKHQVKTEEVKDKNEMAKQFWDKRYADSIYVYGEEPNEYFAESVQSLAVGKIILPAEGEGRNAVYAAQLGWEVDAFDISAEGKKKADKLAKKHDVEINYKVQGFEEFEAALNSYDAIALIYAHVPGENREAYFQQCVNWLKPGGRLIFEGFSKTQLGKKTGGPKDEKMLFSMKELETDLKGLQFDYAEELDIQLNEGEFHRGKGSVVRIIATKQ